MQGKYSVLKLFIWFLFTLLSTPLIAENESAKKNQKKPIIFLGNHDIPPMIYSSESGPKGIVIDLAKAIAKNAKIDATIDAIDWAKAQERLKTGTADALLQINSNPEREKIFDFSGPLLLSEFSIFRQSSRVDIQSIESLYGGTVGVENKGYPKSLLKKHPKINTIIIPSWAEGFKRLSKGELDAIIVDRWVGKFELSKLGINNIKVNKQAVEKSFSAIAVKKGNDELLRKINQGIFNIKQNGTYDKIISNWQDQQVIYLTREQQLFYIFLIISVLASIILLGGLVYLYRVKKDNQIKNDLNKKLEERNEELLQFAYRTSHDLKSPLTTSKKLLEFVNNDIE
jgi:ABC-type amino acid transport substrate-binding protein